MSKLQGSVAGHLGAGVVTSFPTVLCSHSKPHKEKLPELLGPWPSPPDPQPEKNGNKWELKETEQALHLPPRAPACTEQTPSSVSTGGSKEPGRGQAQQSKEQDHLGTGEQEPMGKSCCRNPDDT